MSVLATEIRLTRIRHMLSLIESISTPTLRPMETRCCKKAHMPLRCYKKRDKIVSVAPSELSCQICHHLVSIVRQFVSVQIGQTQLKRNNDRCDNSTTDGLGTTGFELATPSSKVDLGRQDHLQAVFAILCSISTEPQVRERAKVSPTSHQQRRRLNLLDLLTRLCSTPRGCLAIIAQRAYPYKRDPSTKCHRLVASSLAGDRPLCQAAVACQGLRDLIKILVTRNGF